MEEGGNAAEGTEVDFVDLVMRQVKDNKLLDLVEL